LLCARAAHARTDDRARRSRASRRGSRTLNGARRRRSGRDAVGRFDAPTPTPGRGLQTASCIGASGERRAERGRTPCTCASERGLRRAPPRSRACEARARCRGASIRAREERTIRHRSAASGGRARSDGPSGGSKRPGPRARMREAQHRGVCRRLAGEAELGRESSERRRIDGSPRAPPTDRGRVCTRHLVRCVRSRGRTRNRTARPRSRLIYTVVFTAAAPAP